jgi:hypothetical protein
VVTTGVVEWQPGPKNDYKKELESPDGTTPMDAPTAEFALAGSLEELLEELKAKARLIVHGGHRPILVLYERC